MAGPNPAQIDPRPDRPGRVLAEHLLIGGHPDSSERGRSEQRERRVTVNVAESPLCWLMSRKMLTERQFLAGERLRADWTRAGLAPRVTMRWDPAPGGNDRGRLDRMDPTLSQIAARQRFDGAIAALGNGLADIMWRVVCAGEGLAATETALGWPKRSGKLVLTLALDRVADYYGLA